MIWVVREAKIYLVLISFYYFDYISKKKKGFINI